MSPRFRRREQPPAEVVALLSPDDRALSWADVEPAAGAGTVLASTRGLWWPDAGVHRMIGWQFVDKAVWREGTLSIDEADLVDDLLLVERPTLRLPLAVPRDLPPTVRKRVEANVVRSEVHALPGGAGRFVARRVPGRDGVVWWVRLEAGTPDVAEVRTAAREIVAALAAQSPS